MTREEAIKTLKIIHCKGCNDYGDCETCFIGVAIEALEKQEECEQDCKSCWKTNLANDTNKWIPCSERLPRKAGKYLVTIKQGGDVHTTVRRFNPRPTHPMQIRPIFTKHVPLYSGWERATKGVVAWCELPEPYKEGEE